MTQLEMFWPGKTFTVIWPIVNEAGDPVNDSTVSGTVKLPDGVTTAAMSTFRDPANQSRVFFSYTPTEPGKHGYELESSGTAVGNEQGSVVVSREVLGLPPVELDPATAVGKVRLLSLDLDEVSPLLTDAQIEALLSLSAGNVFKAGALALERIAASEALISKKIKTQDLETDGPAVAKELREIAKRLREDAENIDPVTGDPFAGLLIGFEPDCRRF